MDQVGGPFSETIPKTRGTFAPILAVSVPSPGEYEITLTVNLVDGRTPESHSRLYHLRDFLIVGIGDSFASGQGNPDVLAVPAPDQVLA